MTLQKAALIFWFNSLLLSSCVKTPLQPEAEALTVGKNGAYILCEGLYGQNNTSLARYDFESGKLVGNFFERVNRGLKLGDTGNDILVYGDTSYIAVDHSKTIECIRTSTGEWLGRITLPESPRYLCIVNDSTGYYSQWTTNSLVEFNPRTLSLSGIRIPVGPVPEKLSCTGRYIFAANSGLGIYQDTLSGARTISVVDVVTKQELRRLKAGPNTVSVLVIPETNRVYGLYKNIATGWTGDSLGGVIEYDLASFKKLREWRVAAQTYSLISSPDRNTLYIITPRGIEGISLAGNDPGSVLVIKNPKPGKDIWYTLNINPRDGNFWIGNARTNNVSGTLIIANPSGLFQELPTGINPNAIRFF